MPSPYRAPTSALRPSPSTRRTARLATIAAQPAPGARQAHRGVRGVRTRVAGLVLVVLVALAACHTAPTPAASPSAPATTPQPRLIVISIDGLLPDVYLDPDAHGLAVPHLRALAARGLAARGVQSVLPTSTYPAHTTIVTGAVPATHGITTNRPPDGLGKNQEGWRWYAEDIAVPTLWTAAMAQGRTVALITWPVTVGADVTYLVPEVWRAGTVDDQKLVRALSTPGLLDAVARDTPTLWEHLVPPDVHDDAPFAIARHLAARGDVDLMLVHAWAVDDAQHAHGPWSPEAIAAIEHADALLGGLLDVLQASPRWAQTTVVVLSDHGFEPVTTQVRLAPLFIERGINALGPDGKPSRTRVTLAASGGTAYLYLDDPTARADVDAALAAAVAATAIAAVHGKDEIARLGGDPAADYLLVAPPGLQFSEKRTGPLLSPSGGKGDHGMLPDDPSMLAAFIAAGPGIAATEVGTLAMTDLAAMLAGWLAIELR